MNSVYVITVSINKYQCQFKKKVVLHNHFNELLLCIRLLVGMGRMWFEPNTNFGLISPRFFVSDLFTHLLQILLDVPRPHYALPRGAVSQLVICKDVTSLSRAIVYITQIKLFLLLLCDFCWFDRFYHYL